MKNTHSWLCMVLLTSLSLQSLPAQIPMNDMWGMQSEKSKSKDQCKGHLFEWGNYAMFIHWGLYSNLANQWKGKTYYGIGEWLLHHDMAGADREEYKATAQHFNPENFDAEKIVCLAKDAGMKYIIITSKHHEGFAMYHSKSSKFNIVDATPFHKDPMKELSRACKKHGLGFGFYYSHNQDWTCPGGAGGPSTDAEGNKKDFDDYYLNKCLPQVKEITTQYGDIELVWFDTPGIIPATYSKELVDIVHKNQPKALVSGRVGHNMGDYATLGDMEVPYKNVEGLWESVDVTNDSWGFAWYDKNWKSPKQILMNLISTAARGGTYMLNVGPDGKGEIPEFAAKALRTAGDWIKRYPQAIYGAKPSPWQHALPWGDVIQQGNKLLLCIYQWPMDGEIYLPGLQTCITQAKLWVDGKKENIDFTQSKDWTIFNVPYRRPEKLISVIELELKENEATVHTVQGLDPVLGLTDLSVCFAEENSNKVHKASWMEKYGEWKHKYCINDLHKGGAVSWKINVQRAQTYMLEVNGRGNGKVVWHAETDEGDVVQNQQRVSSIFCKRPMGWIKFDKPGIHTITLKQVEGEAHELAGISLTPVDLE